MAQLFPNPEHCRDQLHRPRFLAHVRQQAAAITLLATTLFLLRCCGMYWTLPGSLIGGENAGFLAGAVNFAGNISGIVAPVIVGLIASATGSYYLALMVFAAVGAGLFLCSIGIRYRRAL
jgi:ACS family D-galactonate transporter-like MFS transporter